PTVNTTLGPGIAISTSATSPKPITWSMVIMPGMVSRVLAPLPRFAVPETLPFGPQPPSWIVPLCGWGPNGGDPRPRAGSALALLADPLGQDDRRTDEAEVLAQAALDVALVARVELAR